jgi:hypothetical protein
MCQTCIDDGSISQFVYDVICAHEDVYDDGYEPYAAHIVIGDNNVEDTHIRFCLDPINCPLLRPETRSFLLWLLTIPEEERVPKLKRTPA